MDHITKMEKVMDARQDEEIDLFYSLIRQDPDLLRAFDKKQFADTPLHSAAKVGRTQLALEIQRLMPSFGRKLDPDGFSPLHLALHHRHTRTVSAMIKLDPELVRVQGKEGITPLHYVAETDDHVDLLAEFLLSCPDSIEELTVRGESVVHVAVKKKKLAALRVLLGWLKRTDRREVLRWRDLEGNAALHLAASTNQPQVMELLLKEGSLCFNDKNLKGLTALDIVMGLPTEVNGRALQILRGKHAGRGSSIHEHGISTFAGYLSSKVTIMESIVKFIAYLEVGVPNEIRSPILVVAVLIATATYQGMLHPPDGFGDQTGPFVVNITSVPHNSSTTTTSINITSNIGVHVLNTQKVENGNGEESMRENRMFLFLGLNSIALAASLGTIASLLPTRRYNILLHVSLLFLMISYTYAMSKPRLIFKINFSIFIISCMVSYLILLVKLRISLELNVRGSRRLMGSNNFFNIHEMITLVYFSKYREN